MPRYFQIDMTSYASKWFNKDNDDDDNDDNDDKKTGKWWTAVAVSKDISWSKQKLSRIQVHNAVKELIISIHTHKHDLHML